MDKSSFSSWLHTAAGGLTCHGRIQALIHLCFPQVFLNFTHGVKPIAKTEADLYVSPEGTCMACPAPGKPSDLRAVKSHASFERDRRKQSADIFQIQVHLFTFQLCNGVTFTSPSLPLLLLFAHVLLQTTPSSPPCCSQPLCMPICLPACSLSLLSERPGLSIYLGGPPFGP